jgi:PAT family beta-lactamase induction signal transducer AmpG
MRDALKQGPHNFFGLYFNKRAMTILFLGFSSGLPLVLLASTLQAWYTESNVSIMMIGTLSLVGQPYTWKFLWAPVFDRFNISYLGRRRSWIVIWQLSIVLGLVLISFNDPKMHPWWVASLALLTAFFSASQDTVIDGYRTDLLAEYERGVGAALISFGYRLGMLVASSVALVIAHEYGWHVTYLIMAALILLCVIATLKGPLPPDTYQVPARFKEAIITPFLDFLKRPYAGTIVLFIITYKLTDALTLSLNTYFILHFLKFSLMDLGVITKISGFMGVFLGSIFGGMFYARIGLYRSLLYFGLLQTFSVLLFVLLSLVGKNYVLMTLSIFGENFCSGLSSVALVVYLTTMCHQSYTATQYAFFSAIMSLGRVYIGPVASYLVESFGWFDFYIIAFLVGFVPLVILKYLHQRQKEFEG